MPAASAGSSPRRRLYDLIELLFFAYRDFVGDPDRLLDDYGFGRAHHRVLHFVNRHPGLTIAELLDILKITKQSLNRVLKELIDKGFVEQRAGPRTAASACFSPRPTGASWRSSSPSCRSGVSCGRSPTAPPGPKRGGEPFLLAMIDPAERAQVERARRRGDRWKERDATAMMEPGDSRRSPTTRRICSSSTTTAASASCWRASSASTAIASRPRRAPPRRAPSAQALAFDLLVLDVMMPGETGFDFARRLRTQSQVPILMLTARAELGRPGHGLEVGADDYLPKPFEPRELLLRLANILKRTARAPRAGRRRRRRSASARSSSASTAASCAAATRSIRITEREREILSMLGRAPPARPCRATSSPAAAAARTSAPSTCRSTACGARSRSIRPTRSICRPSGASATACSSTDADATCPRPPGQRPSTAASRAGSAGPAEGPLRALADHHHHAGGPPPIRHRLCVHGAALAARDPPPVLGRHRRRRGPDRHLRDLSPGQERRDALPHRQRPPRPRRRFPARRDAAAAGAEAVLLDPRPGALRGARARSRGRSGSTPSAARTSSRSGCSSTTP